MTRRLQYILERFAVAATALYLGLIAMFAFVAIDNVLHILERRDAAATAEKMLQQFETRATSPVGSDARTDVSVPAGSPFLEGATASVAGAALLQRVTAATTRVGGNILSSQLDVNRPQSRGSVMVTTSFEIAPAFLQGLLYDLEAGMPFLFVEQLVVQAPAGAVVAESGKLRVLLAVSAQWQGTK